MLESEIRVSGSDVAKIVLGSTIGTFMEYYDLFAYSFVAAIVFSVLFYPSTAGAAVAIAITLASYGVSSLARPFGALVFGTRGDMHGRKTTLVWTLMTMGLATIGLIVTPTYAAIGVLAPALIIFFRIVQGFGVGGEWGGATSWVLEFASKSRWRPLWVGLVQTSALIALAITSAFVTALYALEGKDAFIAFGWRIPFIIGIVILVIGVFIRYKLAESPLYRTLVTEKKVERAPARTAFRNYWKTILASGIVALQTNIGSTLAFPYTVSYLVFLKQSPLPATAASSIGSFLTIPLTLLFAALGRYMRRKTILYIGAAYIFICFVAYFPLVNTLNPALFIPIIALTVASAGPAGGIVPTFYNESYPTGVRYTAAGLSYQLGYLFQGIILVFIIPTVLVYGGVSGSATFFTVMGAIIAILTALATKIMKETKDAVIQ